MTTYFYFQNLKLGLHKKTEIIFFLETYFWQEIDRILGQDLHQDQFWLQYWRNLKKNWVWVKKLKKKIYYIYSKTKWETGTYGPNHLLY